MKLAAVLVALVFAVAGCGDEPPRDIAEDPNEATTPTQPDDY